MAIKVINIGTSANKGDGEPLRTAFIRLMTIFQNCLLKLLILRHVVSQ